MDEQADQFQGVDELLAKATWPAVTQAQVNRLASLYRRQQIRLSLASWGTLAAAAVLLICVGIWTHRLTRPYLTQPLVRESTTDAPRHAIIASREPNLLERAIILSASPKRATRMNAPAPAASRDPLNSAIAAVAAGADATSAAQKLDPNFLDYAALLNQPPRYAVPLSPAMAPTPATS